MSAETGPTHLVVGPFDMLHVGHIRLFAESGGDTRLRVGVLSDALAEQLLGSTPFMPASERAELVAELSMVDGAEIVTFTDLRPMINEHGISSVALDAHLPLASFETGALAARSLPALSQSSSPLLANALRVRIPSRVSFLDEPRSPERISSVEEISA